MKIVYKIITGVVVCLILILGLNYFNLQRHMNEILQADPRNEGVEVWVHYSWLINPNEIKYDLRGVSDNNSTLDVTRVLLQFSEKLKDKNFDKVILSYKGDSKFYFKGEYFKKLGEEYEFQNPIYTLRTMPENVYRIDGEQQYGTWTGGWLGVMGKQMDDLNSFAQDWYLNDILTN